MEKFFNLILALPNLLLGQDDRFLHARRIEFVLMNATHPRITDYFVMQQG
jgi:hypothetical protein